MSSTFSGISPVHGGSPAIASSLKKSARHETPSSEPTPREQELQQKLDERLTSKLSQIRQQIAGSPPAGSAQTIGSQVDVLA